MAAHWNGAAIHTLSISEDPTCMGFDSRVTYRETSDTLCSGRALNPGAFCERVRISLCRSGMKLSIKH